MKIFNHSRSNWMTFSLENVSFLSFNKVVNLQKLIFQV